MTIIIKNKQEATICKTIPRGMSQWALEPNSV